MDFLSLGLERPGREADNSPLSSAKPGKVELRDRFIFLP
jgi:hypothetical protein